MVDESVVIKVQVDKNLLKQIFQENRDAKQSYEHLVDIRDKETSAENTKIRQQLKELTEELNETKKRLADSDSENLNLKLEMKQLNRKLRLEEERNKSVDLENVESKLLKLKVQTLENENMYLKDDFQRERTILINQNKPRVQRIEQNISLLRKWIEKEMKERYPRETDEVKALKSQIQSMVNDKRELMEGFEMERKIFRKILKSNGVHGDDSHVPRQ